MGDNLSAVNLGAGATPTAVAAGTNTPNINATLFRP